VRSARRREVRAHSSAEPELQLLRGTIREDDPSRVSQSVRDFRRAPPPLPRPAVRRALPGRALSSADRQPTHPGRDLHRATTTRSSVRSHAGHASAGYSSSTIERRENSGCVFGRYEVSPAQVVTSRRASAKPYTRPAEIYQNSLPPDSLSSSNAVRSRRHFPAMQASERLRAAGLRFSPAR
jgi:hypothetical protein